MKTNGLAICRSEEDVGSPEVRKEELKDAIDDLDFDRDGSDAVRKQVWMLGIGIDMLMSRLIRSELWFSLRMLLEKHKALFVGSCLYQFNESQGETEM